MADACQRASASRITALMPYLGYAPAGPAPRAARVPITAKLVANLIATAGIDRVLTVDVHADQIQGFFDIPVDNVYASPVLLGDVWKQEYPNMVVVSPDVGGVVRARALAKRLDDAELAIIDKRRPQPNMAEVMNIIGEVVGQDLRARWTTWSTRPARSARRPRCSNSAAPCGSWPISRIRSCPALPSSGSAIPSLDEIVVDRYDPAEPGRSGLRHDPPAQRRGAPGRDAAPHQRGGVGELAVPRLAAPGIMRALPGGTNP